jgi:hypothetical protein
MIIETNVPLQQHNSFGIAARAERLLRLRTMDDVQALVTDPLRLEPHFVLGGGSNIVITGDIKRLVIKVELQGRQLISEDDKAWVIQAAAGEDWHEFVAWTLQQGWPGLENLAMIPGMVGASPVQNIGAYGVELQDRFESLDAVDLRIRQVRQQLVSQFREAMPAASTTKNKSGKKKSSKAKAEKEKKEDTKEQSIRLFLAGKTREEIATERGYTLGTIMTHLSHGVKTGQIQVEALVDQEAIWEIQGVAENLGSLKAYFEHFEGKYDYDTLRLVLNSER